MFFYLFSTMIILSALGVVFCQNAVRSVLCLISVFINSAGIFILQGAEFVAMINIIVYVGAIAVLFLFVVMMTDVNATKQNIINLKIELITSIIIFTLLVYNLFSISNNSLQSALEQIGLPKTLFEGLSNTDMIGSVLYEHFLGPLQISALMLLVAIVGAISLTFVPNHQTQPIKTRKPIELVNIKPGSSIDNIIYD